MFDQNNSGGEFEVNDKLCHRIIIEEKSERLAILKAEKLGCYWNGCDDGIDCSCCGDRWSINPLLIDLDGWKKNGFDMYVYERDKNMKEAEDIWFRKYGMYPRIKEPKWGKSTRVNIFHGEIYFDTLEQYCQFMADEYGNTTPDIRIIYLDGKVKEFFSNRL